ncbi:MAG: methionine--tRNA ligase, partial [Gallionella sp.]
MARKILVTSALPYANGSIHLGHLVEYIQTDIWVRFQKMQGHEVHYVCADDTHGTPIMLRAQNEGITPEQLIDRVWVEHKADFDGFNIAFDHYGSTNSVETKEFAQDIYRKLRAADLIETKAVEQFYDPVKEMFLPDRFIKGECPKCHAKDQYGDNCEACGATYAPIELINPYSAVSGAQPERRSSEHYFFKLSDARCQEFLSQWTQGTLASQATPPLQQEAANKMKEWFEAGLSNWDISRDAPYFGFEIPDAPGKFFYVWLDAPVGYMGSFKKLCEQKNLNFDEFWNADSKTELYHFIGKDILYFHSLFWPAMLKFANLRTPTQIFAHGFLTVNNEKMSKSRGTFITADSYLKQGLNPEYLRYYYAAKLNGTMEDIDLNLEDFVARVNSDLVGKYINIASRTAGFVSKKFAGELATQAQVNNTLLQEFIAAKGLIATAYEQRDFGKAIREIMRLADRANEYVAQQAPWALAKQEGQEARLHEVCTLSLNMFRLLTLYLKPILPKLAEQVEQFLNVAPLKWSDAEQLLSGKINDYAHLATRIDPKLIEAMVEANKQSMPAAEVVKSPVAATLLPAPQPSPLKGEGAVVGAIAPTIS